MLIARATTRHGNDLLIIGLSKRNVELLGEGKPLDISTYTHGQAIPRELHLVIFSGEDEDAMQGELQGLIGRDTVVDCHGREVQ